MRTSICSLFRGIVSGLAANDKTRTRPWTPYRPYLEELERRDAPAATFVWAAPQAGGLWSAVANWRVNNQVPTTAPAAGDSLVFDDSNNNDSVHDLNVGQIGFASVSIQGYTGTISLQQALNVINLTQASGTITGGNIAVSNSCIWTGGEQSFTNMDIGSDATLSFQDPVGDVGAARLVGSTITNSGGTIIWHSGTITLSCSAITNLNHAAFNVPSPGANKDLIGDYSSLVSFDGGSALNVSGLATFDVRVVATSGATFTLATGSLYLDNTSIGGQATVLNGVQVNIDTDSMLGFSAGPAELQNCNVTIIGAGRIVVGQPLGFQSSAALTFVGQYTIANIEQTGGSLTWSGDLNISNRFQYYGGNWLGGGTLHIEPGATLVIEDPAHDTTFSGTSHASLVNDGRVNVGVEGGWAATLAPFYAGDNLSAAGTFTFAQGCDVTNNGELNIFSGAFTLAAETPALAPTFLNNGIINVDIALPVNPNGVPPNVSTIGVSFRNAGTLNSIVGTLAFGLDVNQISGQTNLSGGSLTFAQNFVIGANSSLNGTGSITCAFQVLNEGTINIGTALNPYGRLNIFGTGGFRNSGVINIAIRGTGLGDYGSLNVTGPVGLGGSLQLTLNGYAPALGDTIPNIFTWESLDPNASAFAILPVGWDLLYGDTGLTISYAGGPPPPPPPP